MILPEYNIIDILTLTSIGVFCFIVGRNSVVKLPGTMVRVACPKCKCIEVFTPVMYNDKIGNRKKYTCTRCWHSFD